MKRVNIVGTSGSGKTTLAAAVSARIGAPHIELDALHWLPKWQERERGEFRALLTEALQADSWVVDGNYGDQGRDLIWARADQLVWLDLPRRTVMKQVTSRTLRRWWRGDLLWGVNREPLRTTLFSRDSIVWWAWSTHAGRRAEYEALLADPPIPTVRLRSTREVDAWLATLPEPAG